MSFIVPAILEENETGFLDRMARVTKLPGIERVQVDFCDGRFVQHRTLPAASIDALSPAFHWEAHLMVWEPADFLDYQIPGFTTIIIHYEAFSGLAGIIKALDAIRAEGLEPGVAICPQTPVSVLKAFEGLTNHFLLLSVEPGFQGGVFVPGTPERIAELRKICPNAIIEVDGGINETNIKAVKDAGADLVVVGSALVKAGDMQGALDMLQSAVQGNIA